MTDTNIKNISSKSANKITDVPKNIYICYNVRRNATKMLKVISAKSDDASFVEKYITGTNPAINTVKKVYISNFILFNEKFASLNCLKNKQAENEKDLNESIVLQKEYTSFTYDPKFPLINKLIRDELESEIAAFDDYKRTSDDLSHEIMILTKLIESPSEIINYYATKMDNGLNPIVVQSKDLSELAGYSVVRPIEDWTDLI